MTKIRFVTYAYPPLFYPRAIQISMLARTLCLQHDLEIIAADFGKKNPSLFPLCAPCDTVRIPESPFGHFFKRMKGDRIKRWLMPDDMYLNLSEFRHYLDSLSWEDVRLVTFGQPMSMHLLGVHYKKRFPSLRWTAHFSDPWNHQDYSTATGLAKKLNYYYESAVFKYADRLFFTSPETIERVLIGPYAAHRSKAYYIPHGYDQALYSATAEPTDDVIHLGYFGTFYGQRQPHSLFGALRQLRALNPGLLHKVKIYFYGAGDGHQYAREVEDLRDCLVFNAGVDFLTSLQLASTMNGLLVIDAPAENSVFFPSKLADYIGANRPILGITPVVGATARILRELGMDVASPDNVDDIMRALSHFLHNIRLKNFTLRQDYRRQYQSDQVTRIFLASMA